MLHDPLLEIVCEYAWPTVTAGRLVVVIVQGGASPTASIAPNDGGFCAGCRTGHTPVLRWRYLRSPLGRTPGGGSLYH